MVTDPDSTIPSTNPGWVCQPEFPPGSWLIVWTTTSVSSFVWNLIRSALRCTSWLSVPRTCGPGWNPTPPVASAVTPKIATPASPIAAIKIALRLFIPLFLSVIWPETSRAYAQSVAPTRASIERLLINPLASTDLERQEQLDQPHFHAGW